TTADAVAAPPEELTPARRALRRLIRRRSAMFGLAVIVFFIAVALLAPYIAPYDPLKTNFLAVRKAPSALYWFGTDEIGRDVLSRVIWGARASLLAGLVSVTIALLCGVPLGAGIVAVSIVSTQPPLLRCEPGTVTESERAWWGGGTGTSSGSAWVAPGSVSAGTITAGERTFRYACRGTTLVSFSRPS
ncbi:MAG TPA: hypothetical protein VGI72_10630, partial [Gaiellales bacterium]